MKTILGKSKLIFKYSSPFIILSLFLIGVPTVILIILSLSGTHFGQAFTYIFQNPNYFVIILHSLILASVTAAICLLIGYPVAFAIYKINDNNNNMSNKILIGFIITPILLNSLLRVLAIKTILGPLNLLGTNTALVIGLVYLYIPFMILCIYNSLCNIDKNIINSSYDLGATRFQTFIKIILPLSKKGIYIGIILTIFPSVTTVIVSYALGNGVNFMIGNIIVGLFSGSTNNIYIMACLSIITSILVIVLIKVFAKIVGQKQLTKILKFKKQAKND